MAAGASPPSFLGVKAPAPSRPVRVAVVGPEGEFFEAFLRASLQVELYDEELEVESYRRGIVTERAQAAALRGRIALHRRRGRFLVALTAPTGEDLAGRGLLVLSPALPEELPAAVRGPTLFAGWRRGRAPAGALSARAMEEGGRGVGSGLPGQAPLILVVDPHVMDPALFPGPGNVEPGGLTWYALTGAIGAAFRLRAVEALYLLPRPLGAKGEAAAFVLARLAARIAAHAAVRRGNTASPGPSRP